MEGFTKVDGVSLEQIMKIIGRHTTSPNQTPKVLPAPPSGSALDNIVVIDSALYVKKDIREAINKISMPIESHGSPTVVQDKYLAVYRPNSVEALKTIGGMVRLERGKVVAYTTVQYQ